jgi:hypothetical protein
VGLRVLRPLLAYCTSAGWWVRVIVEKLVEWRLAGETKVLRENLPQRHFVHHKSHMTRPGFEPGPLRWKASDLILKRMHPVVLIQLISFHPSKHIGPFFRTIAYTRHDVPLVRTIYGLHDPEFATAIFHVLNWNEDLTTALHSMRHDGTRYVTRRQEVKEHKTVARLIYSLFIF